MQLKRLYIKEHKILKDFTIEFPYDFKKYISVFIGANGSGKSTILEVIAQIFSDVFLNEKAKFGFVLEYSVRHTEPIDVASTTSVFHTEYLMVKLFAKNKDEAIHVNVSNARSDKLFDGKVSEKSNLIIEIVESNKTLFFPVFPDNIIIYYSGLSTQMEQLCSKHEAIQRNEFRKGNYLAKRRFIYYRPENFNMLLLSLLSFEFGEIKDYVYEKLGITELSGFYIKMKRPDANWAKGKKAEKVWGAEGVLKDFCLVLQRFAKYTMIEDKGNSIEYHFPTMERLYALKNHYGNEKKLFELLDLALYEGMLDKLSLTLNKGIPQTRSVPQDGEIHFSSSELSEGEQQIITIKGLTELLSGKNTLFLFDEPDTYLHPKWQRQFISELEKTVDSTFESENTYVIATHSPQLLSNAKSDLNFVKIIEDGSLVENTPKYYGREISSILYNLMGVEERNETIRKKLSYLFTLIEDEELVEAEEELKRLTEILGETDPDIINAELQIRYLREDEADN